MSSIRKEVLIQASAQTAWNALRDFGALHTRLARASSPTRASSRARASSPSPTAGGPRTAGGPE